MPYCGMAEGESEDKYQALAHDLLTVDQAAGYLQLSTSSIRSYIRSGKLKAFRVAGLRKVLIQRADLLALLEPARATEL
ncbi:helix-turn-helix domain-containing protein [Armatimonas sp.]|uniref:helix-turn-helix domain-containing protein n=1 Tax=Armatimonas sp. TaxID=1872638 RepID=UPI00286BE2F4|nr:helix-turn-helix domain-containing protein [Armatimonas sp.]